MQDSAVSAASALLAAAHHDALPLHELACAALAMLEARARSLISAAGTDAIATASPQTEGWLQDSIQLLDDVLTALSEAGSLAAVAEPATALLCSTVMSLAALPATHQVRGQLPCGKMWLLTSSDAPSGYV